MHTLVKFCRIALCFLLTFTVLFSALAVIGIRTGNAEFSYSPLPLVLLTVAAVVITVLFLVLPRGKWILLLLAVPLAVGFVLVALDMKNTFVYYEVSGNGLTLWRAMYRHMLPVLFPPLMVPIWLDHRETLRRQNSERDDTPCFADMDPDFHLSPLEDESERKDQRR